MCLARLATSLRSAPRINLLVTGCVLATLVATWAQPWSWKWVDPSSPQGQIHADSTQAVELRTATKARPGQEVKRTCANGEPGPCESDELRATDNAAIPEPLPSASVFAPAAAKADPVSGDPSKRARAGNRCTCAALDPACGCLPTATPCIGADPDAGMPCRYF